MVVSWIKDKKKTVKTENARSLNSEEENKLLNEAQERFEIAKAEKVDHRGRDLHKKWREMDKIYRGDQWQGPVPEHKSTPVLNYTFSLLESVIPRITDNRPEIIVMPRRSQKDQKLAEYLNKVHQYLWYINNMQRKITESTRICMKYGTVIYKSIWEPDMFDGLGDVKYTVVHPMNFFPDPRAHEIEQMDYCFVSVPKSLEYFIRRWPDKGKYVVTDEDSTDTEQLESADRHTQEDKASLKEYWFYDEDGNLCVMSYAGDIVLDIIGGKYDGSDEPIYRHNKFPFSKQVDYPADKEFWGIGEVEIVELLQRLINNFESQIIDNTRLMSNAQWVVDKVRSGLKEEDAWIFDNRPGNVIWTQNVEGVRKEPGTPIPNHIPEHQMQLINAMEHILGIHDVVQGRSPSGVRAASAIIALQESANIRVRQKSQNLEFALQDLAEKATWLVLEHYEEERESRIFGGGEPTTLNVREALLARVVDEAVAIDMLQQGADPEMLTEEEVEHLFKEIKFPEFDVEVKAGASVPYSQAMLYEQAKEFYQLGVIDRQAVLEVTQFPGREAIIERVEGRTPKQGESGMEQEGGRERIGERTFGGEGGMGGMPMGQPVQSAIPPQASPQQME